MGDILAHYIALPILEWVAVIASLFYVVLAAYKNIWCWVAAFISTVTYTYIFYEYYLWMDSLLQVYYIGMAFYGWYTWSQNNKVSTSKIITWGKTSHFKSSMLLLITASVLGFIMDNYTPTDFPYLDSLTTVFAVFATYLVTQKVLENWLYWIVIDAVSIYIYIEKGLQPTAILFLLYVGLAWFGYMKWLADYRVQKGNTLQLIGD